jgi:hypothetical protein
VHAVGTAPAAGVSRSDPRVILDLHESASAARIPLQRPSVDVYGAAIHTWLGRMVNEYQSAEVFEVVADQLARAGVDAARVAEVRAFAAEERQHGVLCGAVVASLGGQARVEVTPPPEVPLHVDAGPLEAALRNLLSVSCLSETVAVALIGAEREDMPEGPLRELLTGIWADECGHAHTGWKLVAELLPDDLVIRERLGEYLEIALGHLEQHELAHLPVEASWPPGAEAWGLCSGASARVLFFETVEQVIVPGLERLGLPGERAWANRRLP